MEQKTIIGINIPVIEETSEGQLRGGFTDLSMSPGDMMRTNMVCRNSRNGTFQLYAKECTLVHRYYSRFPRYHNRTT